MAEFADSTLSKAGVPADAAAVGQEFAKVTMGGVTALIRKEEGVATILVDMEDGTKKTITITTDELDVPRKICYGGIEETLGWEGFD